MDYPLIDPVIVDLPGPLALRWYGMMYLVGFFLAYHLLLRLSKQGRNPIPPDRVGEFVGWAAAGVFLGGRFGYILFYSPEILKEPLRILAVWEGGLSFHGGLIGVAVAIGLYARKLKEPMMALYDVVGLSSAPGILAVRCANFINGELYGRITDASVPWAMRFPSDPVARRLLGIPSAAAHEVYAVAAVAYDNGTWAEIADQVPLRHPSQLYEAGLEGIVLGVALWSLMRLARAKGWRWSQGTFFGMFLTGYAVVRGYVELFRQPDRQFTGPDDPLGVVLGPLTMGQTLSLVFLLVGVTYLVLGTTGKLNRELSWPLRTDADVADARAERDKAAKAESQAKASRKKTSRKKRKAKGKR